MNLRDWLLPNHSNNFRAKLLSNTALAVYAVMFVIANVAFSNISVGKAYALLSTESIIDLHNAERSKQNLSTLTYNPILAESARKKGEAMMASDCWSHYCPNGKSPWDFFQDAGYDYQYAGENLAEGFSDNQVVMQAWMNSKTHRENILKPEFSEIGVAIIFGNYQGLKNNALIVVHFGKPNPNGKSQADPNQSQNITLTSPVNGQAFNTNDIQITGKSSYHGVILDINNVRSGEIIPNGGIFTYKTTLAEGTHTVQAIASHNDSLKSDKVEFSVDTTAPTFELASISLTNNLSTSGGRAFTIAYNKPGDIDVFKVLDVGGNILSLGNTNDSGLKLDLTEDNISNGKTIQIEDRAGNTTNVEFTQQMKDSIIAAANTLPVTTRSEGAFKTNSSFSFSTAQLISLGFIMLIIGLLALDIIYIRKYEHVTGIKIRSRSHLHLPTFIALLIIVLIGNLGAHI
jgi:uncharacterized protein YkwD